MSHIFTQENPKVPVGDANDDPATIPIPSQLGSLLITTDGSGGMGNVYAAVSAGIGFAWVLVASG